MTSTIDDLRTRLDMGGVCLVGAGLSLGARYPDTKNLATLVWDALDADPAARAVVAAELRRQDGPAKDLLSDDWDRLLVAWAAIASSARARKRFQHAFVALDVERSARSSVAHEALARLIHDGSVELVISYNWDSALERAYRRLYGTSIPEGVLFKPHGNVASPDTPWVLPHEDGAVGTELHAKVNELAERHPRTLIAIGYSGSDPVVVEELIAPLSSRWRVVRISPRAAGDDDVSGTAEDVLRALTAPLLQREADSPWSVVTFERQRPIDSALAGERLGPRDVVACPRLPVVAAVTESLLRSHAVVLNGESGCGKSITAYQVASDLADQGFEVLRLRAGSRNAGLAEWSSELRSFPHKKVLFVDDAQDLSADAVRELAETADENQLVLIAGFDHVAGGVVTHTVAGPAAVGLLERHMLDNLDTMLPKLQALDNNIGTGFMDEPPDLRIQVAAKEPNAWLFFYSLTGGWRRTARALQEVRDRDRADILAAALAVAQIASVDSGATVEDLAPHAEAVGRDTNWVEAGLLVLKSRQLAFEQDGVWRCPHLRAAIAIVNWMLHPPHWSHAPIKPVAVAPIASAETAQDDAEQPAAEVARSVLIDPGLPQPVIEEDRRNIVTFLNVALDNKSTPMRGIAWLLGRNLDTEAHWILQEHQVRNPERERALAERALGTRTGSDVTMAAQMLEQLDGPYTPIIKETIWEHLDVVVEWAREVTPETGWAVAALINILINDDRPRVAAAISQIDPVRLAGLCEAGGWPHIYSSHRAIDRISQAGGAAFQQAVGEAFDEAALSRMLSAAPDLLSATELFSVLAYTNQDLGVRLFETHATQFAHEFSRRPIESFSSLSETFMFLLEVTPTTFRSRKPTREQQRATRRLLRALDTRQLEHDLARPRGDHGWFNFPDFIAIFQEFDPKGWAKVAEAVDLATLEQTLVDQLPNPTSQIVSILLSLHDTRSTEVEKLLDRHSDEFETLDTDLAFFHPQLVITLLKRGLVLNLDLEHQNYELAASVLAAIADVDPHIAKEVAHANAAAFAAGLRATVTPAFTDLLGWIAACDQHAPDLIDTTLRNLGPGVVAGWADALGDTKSKRQIQGLVARAANLEVCPARTEAAALISRFPSLRRL